MKKLIRAIYRNLDLFLLCFSALAITITFVGVIFYPEYFFTTHPDFKGGIVK